MFFPKIQFSLATSLVVTTIAATAIAIWVNSETALGVVYLICQLLIAFLAGWDLFCYERIQSRLDSIEFRWFYRFARGLSVSMFFLIWFASSDFWFFVSSGQVSRKLQLEPYPLLFVGMVAGLLPLHAGYYRNSTIQSRAFDALGKFGAFICASIMLVGGGNIIVLAQIANADIFQGGMAPVFLSKGPTGNLNDLLAYANWHEQLVNLAFALTIIIGLGLLIISQGRSLLEFLALSILLIATMGVLAGLGNLFNDTKPIFADFRIEQINEFKIDALELLLFLSVAASYLSYRRVKPEQIPTAFVPVELGLVSSWGYFPILGLIVAELLVASTANPKNQFFNIDNTRFLRVGLAFLLVHLSMERIRAALIESPRIRSLFTYLSMVCVIAGIIYPLAFPFGPMSAGLATTVPFWIVTAVAILVLSTLLLSAFPNARQPYRAPWAQFFWGIVCFYCLFGFYAVCQPNEFSNWLRYLARPIYGSTTLFADSIVQNPALVAIFVLAIYIVTTKQVQLVKGPDLNQSHFYKFSFPRFAFLVCFLPVWTLFIFVVVLRSMVFMTFVANHLKTLN